MPPQLPWRKGEPSTRGHLTLLSQHQSHHVHLPPVGSLLGLDFFKELLLPVAFLCRGGPTTTAIPSTLLPIFTSLSPYSAKDANTFRPLLGQLEVFHSWS